MPKFAKVQELLEFIQYFWSYDALKLDSILYHLCASYVIAAMLDDFNKGFSLFASQMSSNKANILFFSAHQLYALYGHLQITNCISYLDWIYLTINQTIYDAFGTPNFRYALSSLG